VKSKPEGVRRGLGVPLPHLSRQRAIAILKRLGGGAWFGPWRQTLFRKEVEFSGALPERRLGTQSIVFAG